MPPPPILKPKPSFSNSQDPPTPSTPHGFRAQLNHLIPRHSYFRARVHIHQIDSIPFVSGEFSLRWKFKHVHSPPGPRHGLLGIVRTRSKAGDKRSTHPRDDPDHRDLPVDASVPSLVISSSDRDSASSNSSRIPSFSSTSSSTSSGVSTLQSASYTTTNLNTLSEPTISSNSPFSSNSANASHITLSLPTASTNATLTPAPTTLYPSYSDAPPPPALLASNTAARGSTACLELKDHSVHWNHTLSTVLRFDVDRDTACLLPCPLKLVVMQRVKSDDSMGNPQNPRLGAVYLNLSEYVGHGPVDRRYLLRESRTNATLKLTIELEYISGETNYIAPPLPKGEILNGLAGYLEGGLHRTRGHGVHGIDMYGPYRDQEELELDLFGVRRPNKRSWATQRRNPHEDFDSDGDGSDSDNEAPAFDVERLPSAYGTKTTETLIEAIFNPVRTSERRCESPFTIYMPPVAPSRAKSGDRDAGLAFRMGIDARSEFVRQEEVASVYSTESSSGSSGSGPMSRSTHSQHSHNSSESRSVGGGGGGGGRVKEWWKKMASRPETPTGKL